MPILLVVHDMPQAAAEVLEAAVWELSESHWMLGSSMIVATSVSSDYLSDHLRRALRRAGMQGNLLATGICDKPSLAGLPEEGRAWMREQMRDQLEPSA